MALNECVLTMPTAKRYNLNISGIEEAFKNTDPDLVRATLRVLSVSGVPDCVSFAIKVFETFDGKEGREDLRQEALRAIGLIGGVRAVRFATETYQTYNGTGKDVDLRTEAISALSLTFNKRAAPFLKEVAEAEKDNIIGDFAMDALDSCGSMTDIPFVLSIYHHDEAGIDTKVSALNTLANFSQQYRWSKKRMSKDLLDDLSTVAYGALHHENPHMRAFGCRLASQINRHRKVVEHLAKEDHEPYWGSTTVADEAQDCLSCFDD